MKPTPAQYIFASKWPLRLWLVTVSAISIFAAVNFCQPTLESFHDWQFAILFAGSLIVAPVCGCYVSLIFLWFIFGPVFFVRNRLNGAPFHVGDQVMILAGPNRNRVAQVYRVIEDQAKVFVDLGKQRGKDDREVFSFTQVCRENSTNPETPTARTEH